ncbi:hypothetical protein SESBI_48520 [Sesbania bispinosa]|nr:hypothetical protein SESBI_48520 [Sesbania bispinosa]
MATSMKSRKFVLFVTILTLLVVSTSEATRLVPEFSTVGKKVNSELGLRELFNNIVGNSEWHRKSVPSTDCGTPCSETSVPLNRARSFRNTDSLKSFLQFLIDMQLVSLLHSADSNFTFIHPRPLRGGLTSLPWGVQKSAFPASPRRSLFRVCVGCSSTRVTFIHPSPLCEGLSLPTGVQKPVFPAI